MTEAILFVPENWPMAWWGAGEDTVRLTCPACGGFHLYLRRGVTTTLTCESCNLDGVPVVQRAFDKITGRKTQPTIKKASVAS